MSVYSQEFMRMFRGADDTYGIYNIEETALQGKTTGAAATKRGKVTVDLWNKHLAGLQGLGVVPIHNRDQSYFGAIDVDDYSIDIRQVVSRIKAHNLPLVACRTKSGGLHLYLFVKNPCPAREMRSVLSSYAALLGYGDSEIFPKQNEVLVESGDSGNWINMPYFNSNDTDRYAISPRTLKRLSVEDFIKLVEDKSLDKISESFMKSLPEPTEVIDGGPPCLNCLLSNGIPEGMRNDTMALAVVPYAKMKDADDWQKVAEQVNKDHFDPPLTSSELQGIFKSAQKKDWTYACTRHPLKNNCNKQLCATKKYGVRSAGLPVVGSLSKLDVEPPIWYADIEGEGGKTQRIAMPTEALQNFSVFQRIVMEKMHRCPPIPKRAEWHFIVNEVMADLTIIEAPPETRVEGVIQAMLLDFCSENSNDTKMTCIFLGQVFENEKYFYFRGGDFVDYLTRKGVKDYKRNTIFMVLRDLGCSHKFFNLEGRGVNLYFYPVPQKVTVPTANIGPNDVPI